MSLLQNEEFLIWQLRTSYLTSIKDGIGERLINVDSSALFSDPSIRGAGYAVGADIQRTYSPPIPVATAVASEYFSAPVKARFEPSQLGDDEDEGGLVTGRGSTETVGPRPLVKRRRRREQQEEDDSSDLSDESEDEPEGTQRAVQSIRFAKMPVRSRAGSSPIRSFTERGNPEFMVTEASRPTVDNRSRRGSQGAVGAVKQRSRRDTTTSSDMSSENEIDPLVFKRRKIKPSRSNSNANILSDQDEEEEHAEQDRLEDLQEDEAEGSDHESQDSSLSSEFAETADSESLLDVDENHLGTSSLADLMPPGLNINHPPSPRKMRNQQTTTLQALPPPRPISTILPVSALGQAIRARKAKPKNPIEIFAKFSGKGALDPLSIKMYAPFSDSEEKTFEMPLQKFVQDSDTGAAAHVTVADAIGLALWRYHEENMVPSIAREKLDVNRWLLRIVDEGEVEYDFPALNRVSNIIDFTSNNNRPVRGRSRAKAFDEFALVEATEAQYIENKRITPKYTRQYEEFLGTPAEASNSLSERQETDSAIADEPLHAAVPKPFASSHRKGSVTLDQPAIPNVHSTPRLGPPKLLKIHFTSLEAHTQSSTIEVSTDTYIAEVLDSLCRRWSLDKSQHYLRVSGTNTVAPLDRTVEAIGTRTDLDLVRRRFVHEGALGLASTPSSSSPNAPLLLTTEVAGKKGKKPGIVSAGAHPLSQKQDAWGNPSILKRYTVVRKQPMSFAPSHTRTLLLDQDYMHILPGETGKTLFEANAKTTTVPYGMIVGCKVSRRHPKTFRVVVFRERETKRYDFEAQDVQESAEIVAEIQQGMDPFNRKADAA